MKGLFGQAYCLNRYALLCFIIFCTTLLLAQRLMRVQTVTCTFTGGSVPLTQQLQTYVESLRSFTAYWTLKQIVKQFPCVDNITVTRTVDQKMYCDATIKEIAYQVNDDQIITTDGNLFPASYFDSHFVNLAKKCTVQKDFLHHAHDKIVSYLNQFEEELFSLYRISIENEYDIRLYPVTTNEYYIKYTLQNSFDKKIVCQAVEQIALIKKNHPTIYKKNQPIVVDMRFKDQIVFTKENKGIV